MESCIRAKADQRASIFLLGKRDHSADRAGRESRISIKLHARWLRDLSADDLPFLERDSSDSDLESNDPDGDAACIQ